LKLPFIGVLLCLAMNGAIARPGQDVRAPVATSAEEKTWLLGEMRGNGVILPSITSALSEDKFVQVQELAAGQGMAPWAHDPSKPPRLREKLPAAWQSLSSQVHKDFDGIADGTASQETTRQTLARI
jgi:hypothetical protein